MGCCTWLLVREYLINDQSVCARLTVKQLVFITSNNPTCTISPEHGSMFLMSRYQGLASEATADVWYWSCLMGQISCRLASRPFPSCLGWFARTKYFFVWVTVLYWTLLQYKGVKWFHLNNHACTSPPLHQCSTILANMYSNELYSDRNICFVAMPLC